MRYRRVLAACTIQAAQSTVARIADKGSCYLRRDLANSSGIVGMRTPPVRTTLHGDVSHAASSRLSAGYLVYRRAPRRAGAGVVTAECGGFSRAGGRSLFALGDVLVRKPESRTRRSILAPATKRGDT